MLILQVALISRLWITLLEKFQNCAAMSEIIGAHAAITPP